MGLPRQVLLAREVHRLIQGVALDLGLDPLAHLESTLRNLHSLLQLLSPLVVVTAFLIFRDGFAVFVFARGDI